ncbi:vacuolar ATPase assembly integral membrane protein VMA21 [Xylona heveae TC161]|uniref:Vacuolar ATPase assembly integral membrane protein VMA21 n=1 Tax=Xylona heveae (strain CBS 132557 / TC161) TaxID=1328760 RepID=A0A165JAT3_XYLHT|nr:vacuolar ATPase assembly integral membrane protein VMA21 [Xylona heveae TC161]KZF25985.1 vacuolar ATPase assembly integral membrane protein VMA21 [Xylona heveae TC161]
MSSRRIVSNEKTVLDQDSHERNGATDTGKSNIAPAVPASVIIKLLGFTLAMMIGPLGIYYLSLNSLFKGNSTFAGATAAITANIVLIAYVVVAFKEDQSERLEASEAEKKKK